MFLQVIDAGLRQTIHQLIRFKELISLLDIVLVHLDLLDSISV